MPWWDGATGRAASPATAAGAVVAGPAAVAAAPAAAAAVEVAREVAAVAAVLSTRGRKKSVKASTRARLVWSPRRVVGRVCWCGGGMVAPPTAADRAPFTRHSALARQAARRGPPRRPPPLLSPTPGRQPATPAIATAAAAAAAAPLAQTPLPAAKHRDRRAACQRQHTRGEAVTRNHRSSPEIMLTHFGYDHVSPPGTNVNDSTRHWSPNNIHPHDGWRNVVLP